MIGNLFSLGLNFAMPRAYPQQMPKRAWAGTVRIPRTAPVTRTEEGDARSRRYCAFSSVANPRAVAVA